MNYAQLSSTDHLPAPSDERQVALSTEDHGFSTTHSFHLVKADGHRWLTLSVGSSAAAPTDKPYFFGGDCVKGHVTLDLKEPATFRSIDVAITGHLTFDTTTRREFLALHKTVWHAAEPESAPSILKRVLRQRQPGEALNGTHTFAFSLELSEHIDGPERSRLPASFSEPGARFSVNYSISVQVRRTGLSADSWILEPVLYCPSVRPDPFPEARRLAYERGTGRIPGPESAPDAWETLAPIELTGTMPDGRWVKVVYHLSLARPLVYTRGTPIPLSLLLSSTDAQALDLLSAPASPVVKLVCNSLVLNSKSSAVTDRDTRPVQGAVWWPVAAPEGSRRLMGEIHLSTALKPGAALPTWKLSYAVVMHASRVPGFAPMGSAMWFERDPPLQTMEVALASMHARGMPRPVPASAVEYDARGSWTRNAETQLGWQALAFGTDMGGGMPDHGALGF